MSNFYSKQNEKLRSDFPIGLAVRHHDSVIRRAKDYFLSLGHEPARSNAKRAWKAKAEERGQVIAIKTNSQGCDFISARFGESIHDAGSDRISPADLPSNVTA